SPSACYCRPTPLPISRRRKPATGSNRQPRPSVAARSWIPDSDPEAREAALGPPPAIRQTAFHPIPARWTTRQALAVICTQTLRERASTSPLSLPSSLCEPFHTGGDPSQLI